MILAASLALAQPVHPERSTPAPASVTPLELARATHRVEVRHLSVLAGWATVNLVGGTVGYVLADKPEVKTFHGTNAAWNTVNLGLALSGMLGRPKGATLADVQRRQRRIRTLLAVNAGLDVVYIASGLGMALAGSQVSNPSLQGAGASIMLQGAFLMVFDLVFLDAHKQLDRRLAVVPTQGDGRSGFALVGRF